MKTTKNVRLAILALALCSAFFGAACNRKPSASNREDLVNNGESQRFIIIYSEAEGAMGKSILKDTKTGKMYLFVKFYNSGGLVLMPEQEKERVP